MLSHVDLKESSWNNCLNLEHTLGASVAQVLICFYSQLPTLMTQETWHDPLYNTDTPNPWAGADIEFEGAKVVRDVQMDHLSQQGEHGFDTWSWKQYILALEQENYCDFEVAGA